MSIQFLRNFQAKISFEIGSLIVFSPYQRAVRLSSSGSSRKRLPGPHQGRGLGVEAAAVVMVWFVCGGGGIVKRG
jgi:hypothetical protein